MHMREEGVNTKMTAKRVTRFNFANLPRNEEEAVKWAREYGLLRKSKQCRIHRKAMKLYSSSGDHGIGRFRCSVGRTKCRQYSATVDSFFEDVHLPLCKAIKLMYCFARGFSYFDTAYELSDFASRQTSPSGLSTISSWFRYCREMIVDLFTTIQLDKPKLGGVSASGNAIVVQIDEATFGRRTYNRGCRVGGHYVLGMVDVDTNDCRMAVVQDRTAETLMAIIKENVAVGSEIHTDCYRNYAGLTAAGYIHKTFVASNGTHTEKIKSTWRPAKDWMQGRARFLDEDFADRLCEYLWRRFCRHNTIDPMVSLMEAIRMQYAFS